MIAHGAVFGVGEAVRHRGGIAGGHGGGEFLEGTQQVDGVIKDLLGGYAEPATRAAMLSIRSADAQGDAHDGTLRLRELLAITLASPEFQRR
jgi:hypothetical protein